MENKVDHLSASSISTYLRCGKQYWFRYVKGLKSPPGIAQIDGTSYHASMERANTFKLKKGRQIQTPKLLDTYINKLRELTGAKGFKWGEESENNLYKKAKILIPNYSRCVDPKIEPKLVEHRYEKVMGEGKEAFQMVAVTDLVTKKAKSYGETVIDYKTSGQAKSQKEVDDSIQLSIYSWVSKLSRVAYINFVKSANPYIQILVGKRTVSDNAWGQAVCKSVHRSIVAGAFPLADPTSSWWCSPKWCGFWKECRGRFVDINKIKVSE